MFYTIKSKSYSPIPPEKPREPPENICHIEFSSKVVELINSFAIFGNINVASILNGIYKGFGIPTIVM